MKKALKIMIVTSVIGLTVVVAGLVILRAVASADCSNTCLYRGAPDSEVAEFGLVCFCKNAMRAGRLTPRIGE